MCCGQGRPGLDTHGSPWLPGHGDPIFSPGWVKREPGSGEAAYPVLSTESVSPAVRTLNDGFSSGSAHAHLACSAGKRKLPVPEERSAFESLSSLVSLSTGVMPPSAGPKNPDAIVRIRPSEQKSGSNGDTPSQRSMAAEMSPMFRLLATAREDHEAAGLGSKRPDDPKKPLSSGELTLITNINRAVDLYTIPCTMLASNLQNRCRLDLRHVEKFFLTIRKKRKEMSALK